jgi:hypothetical protein
MKHRDDTPYVWTALNGLDFSDFGQLSPAEQSLVLMRAAQIQQSTALSTQHQPQEEENKMANEKVTLKLSAKAARHMQNLKEYSKLSGIPMEQLLDEALTEYIARPVETGKN